LFAEGVGGARDAGGAGGDAPCANLYAGGCGGYALFAGGAAGVGGDAMCATLYARGCGGYVLFVEVLDVLEVPETMRCVLLSMLEAVEGTLCLLEVLDALEEPDVMHCVLLCMLEVMRRVLLCIAGGRGG